MTYIFGVLSKSPFIRPCFPVLRPRPPASPMWHHEVKFDGYRVQLHKDGNHVAVYSRNGHDITRRYPVVAEALARAPTKSFILDAELTACSEDGSPDFQGLLTGPTAPCAPTRVRV